MEFYKQKVLEAARYLRDRMDLSPKIGLFTGTGLGECISSVDISSSVEYKDIPYFPITTVESHMGRLLFGKMQDKNIAILQGRFHLYEGYTPLQITFPIRILQELGVKNLILSNASGGLNKKFEAGDLMIIKDHINLTASNPLVGPNEDRWGIRFPDMIQAYDEGLRTLAKKAGINKKIELKEGVYAGLKGPSLETPAEMRFLRTIGADAVGFSTVLEVIAAVHAGMKVLGLSTITNINDPDTPVPATVEEIIAVARENVHNLETIIKQVVGDMDEHEIN